SPPSFTSGFAARTNTRPMTCDHPRSRHQTRYQKGKPSAEGNRWQPRSSALASVQYAPECAEEPGIKPQADRLQEQGRFVNSLVVAKIRDHITSWRIRRGIISRNRHHKGR